jgi:hypothetical protein
MHKALFVSVAVALLSTAACASSEHQTITADKKDGGGGTQGDDTSSTLPAHDAASFCKALCDREQECDKSLDHQTCTNTCTNANAAVFPKLRGDVVDLIVQCFSGKDCKQVLGGQVVATCASEAIATVAPSEAAVAYCDAFAKAKQACGTTAQKAQCLSTAKLYSDETIAQAQNCTKRPCTEIDTCVAATFGSFGGGVTPAPKPESCTGRFADLQSCQSCAESQCCAEAAACAADSMCRTGMYYCSRANASSSTCVSYMQNASSRSLELLRAYFTCANSKCSSSCGPVITP